ncbi:HTTM domain-containing protein [Pedobacter sp. Hv1]|uniref:HTTM domain-containing protein n=1 Tax=Pedobacter sp. Hv1 TaxID=1740090 RepID=UPI0006D8BE0D|nr:HTTM domain-containing protein [Pedobacter sp. Hv1]KQC00718.1 deoxyribonuclease HsdR [Pedobacter sp. Hv1]
MVINKAIKWIQFPVSIAPLASFRIIFGAMMLLSTIRFWLKGWITTQYVDPTFHFTFMGFDWVQPLGSVGMHFVFFLIGLSALLIALGWWYRIAIVTFFLLFTYVELIDVTYYLNHYYFISVISFLMIWLPAGRFFSLDIKFNPSLKLTEVPRWCIGAIRLQLGLVYFFAGLAKINPDWLLAAQPMKIWLPTKSHLPIIGSLMYQEWVAYFFSWFGAVYDLFIVFFLLNRKTRLLGYLAVLVFHFATALFFPAIGMFPYIMVLCTLIFFSGDFHLRLLGFFAGPLALVKKRNQSNQPRYQKQLLYLFGCFFIIQLIAPIRCLAYSGPLFWTEEGYRFSWRVMLIEKVGTTTFTIRESETGKTYEVNNAEFLTAQQEKMMSTQPDLILRYAHYLADSYARRGIRQPQVYANVYVTLNGRRSAPFVDHTVDLANQQLSFKHYKWILPFTP